MENEIILKFTKKGQNENTTKEVPLNDVLALHNLKYVKTINSKNFIAECEHNAMTVLVTMGKAPAKYRKCCNKTNALATEHEEIKMYNVSAKHAKAKTESMIDETPI